MGLPAGFSRAALPGQEVAAALARNSTGRVTQRKVSRGALTFILTHGVGQSFVAKDVPASEVLSFLKESLPG